MNYKHLFNSIWNTNTEKINFELKVFWNNGFYYKYISYNKEKGGFKK